MKQTTGYAMVLATLGFVLLSIIAGDMFASHTIKLWPNRSSYVLGGLR